MLTPLDYTLIALAALLAGVVNALAGGGTLISFPALLALGVPPVVANITNTVALLPGYVGGMIGQAADLRGQGKRLLWFLPSSLIGGLIGALLLLTTDEALFEALVPWLILVATALLAVQAPLRRWMRQRAGKAAGAALPLPLAVAGIVLAAIYGGYFGAGLSVIVLAVLGLLLDESLTRLNALKQGISFAVNSSAALYFLFSGHVLWTVAAIMAVGALLGGALGGRIAGRIPPDRLRAIVVGVGLVVGVVYLVR
ncbi:MAG: sulfite exporter TauE/SafE family protein [Anaerolineales bacterium]|nr:sulfite exporter TauE/SafE family protein [Anaerolineales bacterium]MCB9128517.1 sulfite exporter TauE/SafE family protein [Ardenticatenales bacterium]